MNTTKLNKLIEQQRKLETQIQLEKNKEKERKRKDETKRKILIGAAILNAKKAGRISHEKLETLLSDYTTRTADRKFLGLKTTPNQGQNEEAY